VSAPHEPSAAPPPAGAALGIGDLVAALEPSFPGVSASKVRFLEDRGLVRPERTAAGYRRYRPADVDRIRLVLTLQRDRFLPLKVIREHLDALDRGERPEDLGEAPAAAQEAVRLGHGIADPDRRWTRAELAREAEVPAPLVDELDQYALLPRAEDGLHPPAALGVVRAAGRLAAHGIEPRHLRPFRAAADRELGLVQSAVAPLATRRDAGTRERAARTAEEIATACLALHTALVRAGLESLDG